jgi:hypothetical protein
MPLSISDRWNTSLSMLLSGPAVWSPESVFGPKYLDRSPSTVVITSASAHRLSSANAYP